MGACATKPKVLKGEEGEAPVPAPEPAKEEVVAATAAAVEGVDATPTNTLPYEAKKDDVVAFVVVDEGIEKNKKAEGEKVDEAAAAGNNINIDNEVIINKEIVEDEKVDDGDQESKARSLGNLFKENEQGKDSKADGSGSSEPVNKEEAKEAAEEKPNNKEEFETTTTKLEAEKSEVPRTPEFVDAIDNEDTSEKTTEAALATTTTETKTEESVEKETETAATETVEKKIEAAAMTELEEKKQEEAK